MTRDAAVTAFRTSTCPRSALTEGEPDIMAGKRTVRLVVQEVAGGAGSDSRPVLTSGIIGQCWSVLAGICHDDVPCMCPGHLAVASYLFPDGATAAERDAERFEAVQTIRALRAAR